MRCRPRLPALLAASLLSLGVPVVLATPAEAAVPPFRSSVSVVTPSDLWASWRPGCPVSPHDLRLLRVTHRGFDGGARTGELVVHADSVARLTRVFQRLYDVGFPIERMVRVDAYRGDDQASMAANNTSGFNCRRVAGSSAWSRHAYGRAVDINPVQNPYVSGSTVEPPAGRAFLNRRSARTGLIMPGDAVVQAFAAEGWTWGGSWSSPKDYQHFESARPLLGDGTFLRVDDNGELYRIAGGAPINVSGWGPFGGPQPWTPVTRRELADLPRYPVDGTFLAAAPRGEVYRVAGGAPVYVDSWAPFGGVQRYVDVDAAAVDRAGQGGPWDHLRATPADGTFIAAAPRGEIYRVAGGAPVYVDSWAPFGGLQPFTDLSAAAFDRAGEPGRWSHLRRTPADGTFVAAAPRGQIYRMAGGAPVYVDSWAPFGGVQPFTDLSATAFDRAGEDGRWRHLRRTPADGTFVAAAPRGEIYRFAGGAPLYVTSWSPFGGVQPFTDVSATALDRAGQTGVWRSVSPFPADGTFLLGSPGGRVYRTQGGIAEHVSDWSQVGGERPATVVNQATVDNAGQPGRWRFLLGVGAYEG